MKNCTIILTVFALILFFQCSKDETKKTITIDQKNVAMFSGETTQLGLIFSTEDLKGKTYQWTTSDINVATVSASGLVTGVRIGETFVTASTSDESLVDSAKITIQPKYNLYLEPYLAFGASAAIVKANETRVLLSEESGLAYLGENDNVVAVLYLFDNDALTGAGVLLETTTDVTSNLMDFLLERYEALTFADEVFYFTDNKGVVAAMSINETLGLNVIYFEETYLKSTSLLREDYKKALIKVRQNM
jgi:hypothetical protein